MWYVNSPRELSANLPTLAGWLIPHITDCLAIPIRTIRVMQHCLGPNSESYVYKGSVGKDGVRFLSFDMIKDAFKDPETGTLTPARNMLAGMSAGVVASMFAVTPTERIKTALIDDARTDKRFRSPWHAVRTIYAETGFLGIYRGFAGTTLKQASATAFRMGTYNILKDYERTRDIPQTTATNFANGSVAGIVTTYATMPFDCLKTRAQSAKGVSTVEAFTTILADDGIKGFWRGTTMRLGRTIFSGGILFTVYEQVADILNPVYAKTVGETSL